MVRFLAFVGAFFLAVLGTLVVLGMIGADRLKTERDVVLIEAPRYAQRTITAIVEDYDPEILIAQSSPAMIAASGGEGNLRLFVRQLGIGLGPASAVTSPACELNGLELSATTAEGRRSEAVVTCAMTIEAERADADIIMTNFRRDGAWSIYGIRVEDARTKDAVGPLVQAPPAASAPGRIGSFPGTARIGEAVSAFQSLRPVLALNETLRIGLRSTLAPRTVGLDGRALPPVLLDTPPLVSAEALERALNAPETVPAAN